MMSPRELVEIWFQRVWSEEDDSAIDDIYTGGEVRGLGAQVTLLPSEFKQFHGAICALLTDIVVTIDRCLDDGEWISVLCTLRARSTSTGEGVETTGNLWVRIKDDKFIEAYNHFDFMALWGQLGFLPTDCFEQGLCGQKVLV